MKKNFCFVSLAILLFCLISCVTTPIEQMYPDRWEKTRIGMSKEEFMVVWPETEFDKFIPDQGIEQWFFVYYGFASYQMEFFQFQDNTLIKYYK